MSKLTEQLYVEFTTGGHPRELAELLKATADEISRYERLPIDETVLQARLRLLPHHRILNQDEIDCIFGDRQSDVQKAARTFVPILSQEEIDSLLGFDDEEEEEGTFDMAAEWEAMLAVKPPPPKDRRGAPDFIIYDDEEALMKEWAAMAGDAPPPSKKSDKVSEPSMDEILASIRRILSEDEEEDRPKPPPVVKVKDESIVPPTHANRIKDLEEKVNTLFERIHYLETVGAPDGPLRY
jgi:hypothetical protein